MTPEVLAPPAPASRMKLWAAILLPLVLLAGVLALIIAVDPAERLRDPAAPPVENLAIRRAWLQPDGIVLSVFNESPEPLTIAQVPVDDAYWQSPRTGPLVRRSVGRRRANPGGGSLSPCD